MASRAPKPSRRDLLQTTLAGAAAASVGVLGNTQPAAAQVPQPPTSWTREADVVVIGSGATGLPAAIAAKEGGAASVIVIEAQKDIGGHAITSGGTMPLGGGTVQQKKYGIDDSADLIFRDLTDWSVVEPNGFPDYRFNDKDIIRAFADNSVATYDWLVAHGVVFVDVAPGSSGLATGNSRQRSVAAAAMNWPYVQTGKAVDPAVAKTTGTGNGVMRPLEAAARAAGIEILLQNRMTAIYRQNPNSGPVLGVAVTSNGQQINIRAHRAVVVATGGGTGNINYRRMFDPRLTAEYDGLTGMPWSDQDASGELAAMSVGASLWGLYNQTGEFGINVAKVGNIGCQYGTAGVKWLPGSSIFNLAGASGLTVLNWQDLITVNMIGKRFYDETKGNWSANVYNSVNPYVPGSYLNAKNIKYDPNAYLDAAMAGIDDGHNGGGPIWAIFDADAVAREKWDPTPPNVDIAGGRFFSANTLSDLAGKIVMKHQRVDMPPANLEATVARYNSFVDSGVDDDFGKPKPLHKIATPPFYAAWATPTVHDSRAGLRINASCQVMDFNGQVIPGLYCGGESAGGFSQHGLARAIVQGVIAGKAAGKEASK